MFEQGNPKNTPSGGQAAALVLLHQFIATPGTFLVALVAIGITRTGEVRVVPGMLLRSLGTAIFCFCVALSVGYLIGLCFPARNRFGYWVWIVPTIWLIAGFGMEVGFHRV